MDYRLVASPRATALRSFFAYLALVPLLALVGCAGKGGTTATGGSGGSNGTGGSSATGGSGGSTGSGGSPATGGSPGTGGIVATGGSPGTGGTPATGGSPGTGGTHATGGSPGTGGTSVGDAGTDAACQTADYQFVPQIPTVMILVDRSGSEFTDATDGVFFTLRTAVEAVVSKLDSQVRFGLASFVGDHSSGACKLNYQSVPIALNNSATMKTAYDGWGPLLPYGSKADTPAVEAIPMVQAALQADTGTGKKYMMIVTDGETDFCDDGNSLCPADAVTSMIQSMYNATPSIGTLVIGLADASPTNQIEPQVLQDFANAGAGSRSQFRRASAP